MINCLINKAGKQVFCNGGMHVNICLQQFKISLRQFLKSGGVRVLSYTETMAIEFKQPLTDKQNKIVNKLLEEYPVYIVILPKETIQKMRPIRSLNLC